MIKIKDGRLEVEGSKSEIYAELTTIIHELYEEKTLSKKGIEKSMRLAFLRESELEEERKKAKKEFEQAKKEAIEKISELIKELL